MLEGVARGPSLAFGCLGTALLRGGRSGRVGGGGSGHGSCSDDGEHGGNRMPCNRNIFKRLQTEEAFPDGPRVPTIAALLVNLSALIGNAQPRRQSFMIKALYGTQM